jgi:hypothetical protein
MLRRVIAARVDPLHRFGAALSEREPGMIPVGGVQLVFGPPLTRSGPAGYTQTAC